MTRPEHRPLRISSGGSPANGHERFGSRATRLLSKVGVRPISGRRLEALLREEAERRGEGPR